MSDTLTQTEPLATFITVNTRTPHFIRNLLQGVQAAKWEFPFEYFVVDNGSHDGSVEMLRERFPWVKIIENDRNLGFGPSNNRAMRQAKGKYVALINPDLTLFPGECEKWLAWMETHPEVAMTGPRLKNPDGEDQDSVCRFHELLTPAYRRTPLGRTPWGRRALDRYLAKDLDRTREQEVDWVLGAAVLMRRAALERVNYFDERFFLYFEDEDLCRRFWEAGEKVMYVPDASFVHYYQRESRITHWWEALTKRKTRIHILSGLKYFIKYARKGNPRIKQISV